jgi:hypothetical protein
MTITKKKEAEKNLRKNVKKQQKKKKKKYINQRLIFFQGLLAIPDFISGIHKSEVVLEALQPEKLAGLQYYYY